jgi:ubiquitin thioesterase OTU1
MRKEIAPVDTNISQGAMSIENPSNHLREQIAEYIIQHPDQYSKAILGDEPTRYVSRILEKDTWGGAIELSILSDIYNCEIASIDVKVGKSLINPDSRTDHV